MTKFQGPLLSSPWSLLVHFTSRIIIYGCIPTLFGDRCTVLRQNTSDANLLTTSSHIVELDDQSQNEEEHYKNYFIRASPFDKRWVHFNDWWKWELSHLPKKMFTKFVKAKYRLNTLLRLENSKDNKPHESLVQLDIPFTCPNSGQFHLAANSALTVQQRTVHLATINTTNPHFKYRPQLEISC